VSRFGVRPSRDSQPASGLSGGNQQKVALGRWIECSPRVLLLDEPTRGVDVGAKEELHRLLDGLARQGTAILMASSEMEELLSTADRIVVLREGGIAGELGREEASESAIMALATGLETGPAKRKDGTAA
jgi:ABC-type sugar transport system ATPase subunit